MKNIMDTMTTDKTRTRRNYSPELKATILAECAAPGTSVAKVAMAHGINANIVHGWRKLVREGATSEVAPLAGFIPIAVAAEPAAPANDVGHISIELHRAGLLVKINWPLSAAEQLSAWTRELLR